MMKTMIFFRRLNSGIVLFIMATMLSSCNLEDFNLNKLADPVDITPEVFAPLAYGKFKVQDLVTFVIPDTARIPPGVGLPLNPVSISKTGTAFRNTAVDSVYLILHITNESPVDIQLTLSFLSSLTGPAIGKTFTSAPVPAGIKDYRIQFDLGPTDQDNLVNCTHIGLDFTLLSPITGTLTYGAAKSKSIMVKIAAYVPVQLWKLKL